MRAHDISRCLLGQPSQISIYAGVTVAILLFSNLSTWAGGVAGNLDVCGVDSAFFCNPRHRQGVSLGVSMEISMSVASIPLFCNPQHRQGVSPEISMSVVSISPLVARLVGLVPRPCLGRLSYEYMVAVSLSVRLVGLVPCPSLCSFVL